MKKILMTVLAFEADFEQNHMSDKDDEESSSTGSMRDRVMRSERSDNSSSDDDVQLSERQRSRSKYYYSDNRYNWANNPPFRRVSEFLRTT